MKLKKLIGCTLLGIGCVSLTACHDLYVEDGYYDGGYHHGGHHRPPPPPPPRDNGPKGHPVPHGQGHHNPPPPHAGKDGYHKPVPHPDGNRQGYPDSHHGIPGKPGQHGQRIPQGKNGGNLPPPHHSGYNHRMNH